MIEPGTVRFASAGIYAVSAVALLALASRKPAELRRYCYPFVAVVALAGVGVGLWGAGIGTIPIASGTLEGGQLLTDYVAYPFLFGFAAFVAGASRRYIGAVVAVTVAMRLGYDFAEVFAGPLATAGTLGILVGYAALVGLFFGPVASAASRQPPARELFYKKTRNLSLFAFGVLIAWAMLQIAGVFDAFTATVTLEYLDLLLRVGFAGFVFANVETLAAETESAEGDDGGRVASATTGASAAD
ncbi:MULTISPECIES: bacteriorhodopsin [Halorubrum]|uniref:bacteriorhodopsin n=1 Tax=Halorubrum TaxID=56688 RepID=UPI00067781BD|nr:MULTISPECIES: bacteriorhodopsin [Halorubrum]